MMSLSVIARTALQPAPFVGKVTHCFGAVFDPLHERTIEFDFAAALGFQEAAYVLSTAMRSCYQRSSADRSTVAVEFRHMVIL